MDFSPQMRLDRFYSDRIEDGKIILYGQENEHAVRVLRKRTGDTVAVFDGKGNEFIAKIVQVGKGQSILEIIQKVPSREYPFHIAVAQSLIKHNRWDWFLEKITEIGVKEIIPLLTEHAVVKTEAKKSRWEKIILNACKQSGRQSIPSLHPPIDIEELIGISGTYTTRLVAHPGGREIIQVPLSSRILIAIGPEGGFSGAEVEKLEESGFVRVSLGRFILRSETAPVYAASVLVQRLLNHSGG